MWLHNPEEQDSHIRRENIEFHEFYVLHTLLILMLPIIMT
jgi:hypothetical protein